jgi:hypothetical protein
MRSGKNKPFSGIFRRKPSNTYNDPTLTMDDHYNVVKVDKKKEVNRILDKISKRGYKSISKKEKEFLTEYSDKM